MSPFEAGFLLGVLVGEGHFGGDGRKPHVTLRMHTRHEQLFRWLVSVVPGSRLYGPYQHGGRSYYQWMARDRCLRDELLPLLSRHIAFFDEHVRHRVEAMCDKYGLSLVPHADQASPVVR